jgi:uncharacterized protein (DUF2461 family)
MKIQALKAHNERAWLFNLNNTMYQFLPDELGRMVCDVEDKYHQSLMLDRPLAFAVVEEAPRRVVRIRRSRKPDDGFADVPTRTAG